MPTCLEANLSDWSVSNQITNRSGHPRRCFGLLKVLNAGSEVTVKQLSVRPKQTVPARLGDGTDRKAAARNRSSPSESGRSPMVAIGRLSADERSGHGGRREATVIDGSSRGVMVAIGTSINLVRVEDS